MLRHRNRIAFFALVGCIAAALRGTLFAEDLLIRARRVHPVAARPIENGQVLVRDGKIAEVGERTSVQPGSPGVRVIDVPGSLVPGFIDCGSDIGVQGRAAEEWSELTPEARVLDAVDFDHPEIERALAEGVTAVAVSPGARNVVGGLGVVLRTGRKFSRAATIVLEHDAFLDVSLADEAAAGNFNLRFSRPFTYTFRLPNTRMGTVFLARRAFFEALEKPDPEVLPRWLLPEGKSLLLAALRGKVRLRVHAGDRQEILAALRLAEEFEARIQIVGGAEARESIPRLLASRIPVLLYPGATPRDEHPERFPAYTARLPGLLARAGVPFAFFSGDGDEVPLLRTRVAMGLRLELSDEKALEALTLGAARILGIESRTGSIEPGKDADLVALSGEPLDVTSAVLWTMAGGKVDREMEQEF